MNPKEIVKQMPLEEWLEILKWFEKYIWYKK